VSWSLKAKDEILRREDKIRSWKGTAEAKGIEFEDRPIEIESKSTITSVECLSPCIREV